MRKNISALIILSLIWVSGFNTDANAGPIASRTRVTEISLNADIDPGRADNIGLFSTFADLKSIALSPSPNGESKVGWVDTGGNIHVTPLLSSDERKGADLIVGTGRLYDLVAHDDGFAMLVMQENRMYIERYTNGGSRLFRKELTDADDRVDDWHCGKLAYDGTRYAAYFAIHGTAGWTEGHEGDKLKYVDDVGDIEPGGWEWGCSHSMDVRLFFNGTLDMPFCISDCYPGKGVYLNNQYLISTADGDCAGITNARFGQAVTAAGHGVLVYLSIEDRTHWGVIFASFETAPPFSVIAEKTLTATTDQNEINPKIVPFDSGEILASWEVSGGNSRTFRLFDAEGNALADAESLDVHAGPVNDMKVFPNGDIGWAWVWGATDRLKVVRIQMSAGGGLLPALHLLLE
jgi:hypothetical protein